MLLCSCVFCIQNDLFNAFNIIFHRRCILAYIKSDIISGQVIVVCSVKVGHCCCCLPTMMTLARGESDLTTCGPPASFSVHRDTDRVCLQIQG